MIECEFIIKHKGDWSETINEEFPEIRATVLYAYRPGANTGEIVEAVEVDDPAILADWFLDRPAVVDVDAMSYHKDNRVAYLVVELDYDQSEAPEAVLDALTKHQCFPTLPITIENGQERFSVIAPSREKLRAAHEALQKHGPVEILNLTSPKSTQTLSGLTDIKTAVNNLTNRQREILELAIECGYYESPRKATLSEVAENATVNLSTIGDHLRRTEAKILPAVRSLL
jgi:predicted DNA binding protein